VGERETETLLVRAECGIEAPPDARDGSRTWVTTRGRTSGQKRSRSARSAPSGSSVDSGAHLANTACETFSVQGGGLL